MIDCGIYGKVGERNLESAVQAECTTAEEELQSDLLFPDSTVYEGILSVAGRKGRTASACMALPRRTWPASQGFHGEQKDTQGQGEIPHDDGDLSQSESQFRKIGQNRKAE